MDLPFESSMVHPIFYVSMLKKLIGDLSSTVPTKNVNVEENLTHKEVSIEILD